MSLHRPKKTINNLPDDVFVEIFSHCRMDEISQVAQNHRPWKWQRLTHVCRTWRNIMFASSRRLHLELLYTNGTPVEEDLTHLPAFPIVISYTSNDFLGNDIYDLVAALKQRDRIRTIEVICWGAEMGILDAVMQKPFPALTHLWFEFSVEFYAVVKTLPDTFLGGSAPHLQTIHMSGVPFPAAPTLLSSAHNLVDVCLRNIPATGYISPEAMVSSLAVLPRLQYLTFELGMSYSSRIRQLPDTRTVLPALRRFTFRGAFRYLEDLVAQIDTPQIDCLRIVYLWHREVAGFQIPDLCKFISRSEKLRFTRAEVFFQRDTVIIELAQRGQSSFCLSVQEDAVGRVINQLSAVLSDVGHLFINSKPTGGYVKLCYVINWLELFQPFTALKVLSVDEGLSGRVSFALEDVTEYGTAEVLPTLKLLFLENEPLTSIKKFVTDRQNMGRPVTVINEERVFKEGLNTLGVTE